MLQVVLSDEQNLSISQDLSHLGSNFRISKQTLVKIVSAAQERLFAEEIDELENIDGLQNLEMSLCTNFTKGLKGDDFKEREILFGNNKKPVIPPKTYIKLLLQALEDFIMRVLLVASIVSIIIGVATADDDHRSLAWIEGFAIFIAVFVCCNVTAVNDYQKERQFQSLNQMADSRKTVTVWRDGCKIDLHQSLVMVGDIIQIFEGMEIPADCLVVEAAELTSDESAMTGETDPIKKDTYVNCKKQRDKLKDQQNSCGRHDVSSPVMLSGTKVLSGEGKMIVVVVGDSSCVGKISSLLATEDVQTTPLQEKLEAIAQDVGKFGLVSSALILFILLLRFAIERIKDNSFEKDHIKEMLNFIIISITVIVVAIPEGLPLAVTLSLAYSTKRMLKDNNLVRKMAACETMGGADMVCSDKTGTLTQNKMFMVSIWNDTLMDIDVYNEQLNLSTYFPSQMHDLYVQASIVNGTAMIRPEEKGSKTEIAMILFAEKCGIIYEKERELHVASMKIPFSSKRKRMAMIIGKRLVIKGASEIILEGCNKLHSKSQGIISIDSMVRQNIEKAIENMASKSLRTIGLAYRELDGTEDLTNKNDKGVYNVETENLILIAIVGIKDILRPEVPGAVASCKTAGIKVRMVTGDNKITAKAIAKECGILIDENQSLVLEGPDFVNRIGGVICKWCKTAICDCPRDQTTAKQIGKQVRVDTIKNGEEFDKLYPFLDVLARSRPEDKYALVTGLLERGHVVAVTGDGTNDAPALKKADVGFAMGIAGTEVARESASIILLDDNFSSIVKAVMWGRNIYDSIKKFLQFQLTVNVVAVTMTLISSVLLKQEVLEPIQMLWVNLIMDTFASLALATETPTEELLQRKPHNRNEYMISQKMFKHIIGQAIFQMIVMLVLLFSAQDFIPEFKGQEDDSKDFQGKLQYKYSNTQYDDKLKIHSCPNYQDYCNLVSFSTDFYVDGSENYEAFYKETYIPSRQFTVIFNTFVMMQLFNFMNARRIKDELNIFSGIFTNILFPIIVIGILTLQIILVTFGGIVFHCYTYFGLRIEQWLICVALGSGGLFVRMILRLIPDPKLAFLNKLGQEEKEAHKLVSPTAQNNISYQIQVIRQESELANLNDQGLDSRMM
ncbi:unnamed protein product [Paramecium sonneborni]|uniref:P-type Ca(2+) transporter n=1 Tax=Paramecium sonneborni TaxID=65129 RepID=A0A8S1Q809_9CILI|nr:unnamed protein product [Paramecium sonneborni]